MQSALVLAAFVAVASAASAASCPPPDGVQNQLFFANCPGTNIIQVNTMQITDTSGNVVYPIDFSKALVLNANSTYSGGPPVASLKESVNVYVYTSFFGKCGWHELPIPTIHENQCGNCPLLPGALSLKYNLDLSAFGSIINALGKNAVVKLAVKVYNGGTSTPQLLSCVNVEGIIL